MIYYFSGTGNSAAVSVWAEQVAAKTGIRCQLNNIALIDRKNIQKPPPGSLLGFISPTHGFNYPPIMIHFLFRFPVSKGNKVFFMNTRAGMKLWKIYLMGLSGMALYFSSVLFLLKGYRIAGMRPVDLPSTWISIHPGIREKVYKSIILRRKKQCQKFFSKLFSGKRDFRGIWSLPVDLFITPISVLYYIIGRFGLAKTYFASSKCTNCGLCESSCPVLAIKTIDSRRYWTYKCESCMKCMNQCPERAIETPHGFFALIIFIGSSVILASLNQAVHYHSFLKEHLPDRIGGFIAFAVDNLVLILTIFLGYRIMHFLLRYKLFEKIIVYTSLTKFRFWRRYRPRWKEYV